MSASSPSSPVLSINHPTLGNTNIRNCNVNNLKGVTFSERMYRVLSLVEFDESDGTSFVWSDVSGVEIDIRAITHVTQNYYGLHPNSQHSSSGGGNGGSSSGNNNSNSNSNHSNNQSGNNGNSSIPPSNFSSPHQRHHHLSHHANAGNGDDSVLGNTFNNPNSNCCPSYQVEGTRPLMRDNLFSGEIEAACRKVASSFIQCDINSEPAQSLHPQAQAHLQQMHQQNNTTGGNSNNGGGSSNLQSYPETPMTSFTTSSNQAHQIHASNTGDGSFPNVPVGAENSMGSSMNNNNNHNNSAIDSELHFIQFSDIVAPVTATAHDQTITKKSHHNHHHHSRSTAESTAGRSGGGGIPHFVRATACRFEVTDAFARGFSRLFVLMSATMIKATTEFNQELLNAACNAQHTLDTYDCMTEYVEKAKSCFDFRYFHFLPRSIETIDSYLNRIQELGALQGGPSKGKLDDVKGLLNVAPRTNPAVIRNENNQDFDGNYNNSCSSGSNNINNFLKDDQFLIDQELEKASEALRKKIETQVAEKKEREEREKQEQLEEEQTRLRLQKEKEEQETKEIALKNKNALKGTTTTSLLADEDEDHDDDEGDIKGDKEDDDEQQNFNDSISKRIELDHEDANDEKEMKTKTNFAKDNDDNDDEKENDEKDKIDVLLSSPSSTSYSAATDPFRPQNLDVILQWCLKRGGRGNLLGFENVIQMYGGDEAEYIRENFINTCAFGAVERRSNNQNHNSTKRRSSVSNTANTSANVLGTATVMSNNEAIESLFTSLQEAFGENLYFGSFSSSFPNHDEGSVTVNMGIGGGGRNSSSTMTFTNRLQQPSVAALFSASDGRRDDFLVDPCLTDDPSTWPALLWNGTEYLKIQKKQNQTASENENNLCIASTHFFA